METIKMTQEGYNEQLKKLADLEMKFRKNEIAMTESCKNSSGDGPHDNGEFESLLANERMLVSQINTLNEKIKHIEIIKVENLTDDIINIGDSVSLNLIFSADDTEDVTVTLVGADANIEQNAISINSPLGNAIYKQKVGNTVKYQVSGNNFLAHIIKKIDKAKTNYESENGKKRI